MTGTKYERDFQGPTWADVYSFISDLEREKGVQVHITLDPTRSRPDAPVHGFYVRAEARKRLKELGGVYCGSWHMQGNKGERTAPGAIWWALHEVWEKIEAAEAEEDQASQSE